MAVTVDELLKALKPAKLQEMENEITAKLEQLKTRESELRSDLEELGRLKKKLS